MKRKGIPVSILLSLVLIFIGCAVTPQELPKLYKKNVPAVVSVFVDRMNPQTGETKIGLSGSGFIIDKQKGMIVIAAHVVKNNKVCQVELSSGLKINGTVQFIDWLCDTAIIKVNPNNFPKDIPNLEFGLNPTIGEPLFCIGSAGGHAGIISFGILSSNLIIEQDIMSFNPGSFYLSDIHINGGNSGCPVFNLENKVVGMAIQFYGSYTLIIPARVISKVYTEWSIGDE